MTNFKRTTHFTPVTANPMAGPTDGGDPKRWLDEGSSSLLGSLTRAGAEERPSMSAKHRARAAVLLATAGGAASAAATKAAVASTTAGTSAPPAALAASGVATSGAATSGAATSGAATASGAATSLAGVGTAGVATTGTGLATTSIAGAAGLSAKFGASAVVLGVAAKWTGVSAMVAAVGFGGYQLASSGGAVPRLTDAAPSSSIVATSSVAAPNKPVTTLEVRNTPGTPTSEQARANQPEAEVPFVSPELGAPSGTSAAEREATSRPSTSGVSSRRQVEPAGERVTSSSRASSGPVEPGGAATELPTTLQRNRELALVDRAWTALRSGNPSEALRLIDGYPWAASDHQFEAEALLIRLEGLNQSGQHTAARALARRVLQNHQRGRLAERARRVLGTVEPNQL